MQHLLLNFGYGLKRDAWGLLQTYLTRLVNVTPRSNIIPKYLISVFPFKWCAIQYHGC